MAFKLKGFPLINGTKPMKMKKDAAMKMKKAAMQLKKEEAAMKLMKEKESAMKIGQSPKKAESKPDFLDLDKDGNKTESMKKAAADKKNPAMQMKSAMKLKDEAMKMKSPMRNEKNKKSGRITKDEKGSVTRRTGDEAFYKTFQKIMNTTPGITLADAKKLARKQLDASM